MTLCAYQIATQLALVSLACGDGIFILLFAYNNNDNVIVIAEMSWYQQSTDFCARDRGCFVSLP